MRAAVLAVAALTLGGCVLSGVPDRRMAALGAEHRASIAAVEAGGETEAAE